MDTSNPRQTPGLYRLSELVERHGLVCIIEAHNAGKLALHGYDQTYIGDSLLDSTAERVPLERPMQVVMLPPDRIWWPRVIRDGGAGPNCLWVTSVDGTGDGLPGSTDTHVQSALTRLCCKLGRRARIGYDVVAFKHEVDAAWPEVEVPAPGAAGAPVKPGLTLCMEEHARRVASNSVSRRDDGEPNQAGEAAALLAWLDQVHDLPATEVPDESTLRKALRKSGFRPQVKPGRN